MTKSAKFALAEGGVHSIKPSTSQHFVVNLMFLLNYKNTTKTSLVEGVNFLLLRS